jgi:uncharacterized membrane protein YcaP (DUF421 family)
VFFDVEWRQLIGIDTPLLEIFLRGSITYLFLFVLMRLLRREPGAIDTADLLVLVLIADAAQNGMAGEYTSITDGLILVSTLLFWSYGLNWLGFRFEVLGRFIHPPPLPLIVDGKEVRRNLKKELLTREELMTQLREQGVDNIADVKRAWMEGDGRISVLKSDGEQHKPSRESTPI